jgi:glycosyltransferase involved in cell wall biosynthesis
LQPSLSLIIPVYNEERTLANRVQRVLELLPELSSRFEVLVIDNGSLDHTCDAADELAREYPQIKVIRHGERRGMDAVTETSLAKSHGEIIMLLTPGVALQPAEIKRLWQTCRSESTFSQPRSSTLMGRLSQWGQVATQPKVETTSSVQLLHRHGESVTPAAHISSPRRPVSFLEHLRGLSVAE